MHLGPKRTEFLGSFGNLKEKKSVYLLNKEALKSLFSPVDACIYQNAGGQGIS